MRRFVLTAVVLTTLTWGATAGWSQTCVGVIAHRGASSVAPENTLRAINRAAAKGAALVEVDVRRTSDGRYVLMHDAGLERTTNVEEHDAIGPWAIASTPWTQIKRLDAGTWKDGRYAAVPRLADALGTGAPLLLETKVPVPYWRVNTWASAGGVTVHTFNVTWARGFAAAYPDVPLWLVSAKTPTAEDIADWSQWADAIAVRHDALDAATVAAAHDAGLAVAAWTVDDQVTALSMVAMSVDSIITNRVTATRSWVGC